MSEIEVVEHIAFRSEMNWNIVQWWISVSFGLMIASFVGSEHLTKGLTLLSVSLYTLYSATSLIAIFNQNNYINGAYETLEILSNITEMTPLGQVALENARNPGIQLMPILCLVGFLCTIGFSIFCLVKKPNIKK